MKVENLLPHPRAAAGASRYGSAVSSVLRSACSDLRSWRRADFFILATDDISNSI